MWGEKRHQALLYEIDSTEEDRGTTGCAKTIDGSAVSPHEECDGVRFCGSQIGPHGLDPFKGMMGPSRHLDSSFLKRKTKMWPVFDASAQILQTNAHLNVAAFFQIYKII